MVRGGWLCQPHVSVSSGQENQRGQQNGIVNHMFPFGNLFFGSHLEFLSRLRGLLDSFEGCRGGAGGGLGLAH